MNLKKNRKMVECDFTFLTLVKKFPLRLQGNLASPIMSKHLWSNMYYCVNILLTKNVFVQNQLHIAGQQDSISFSYIPVASQCISLLKPSVY